MLKAFAIAASILCGVGIGTALYKYMQDPQVQSEQRKEDLGLVKAWSASSGSTRSTAAASDSSLPSAICDSDCFMCCVHKVYVPCARPCDDVNTVCLASCDLNHAPDTPGRKACLSKCEFDWKKCTDTCKAKNSACQKACVPADDSAG